MNDNAFEPNATDSVTSDEQLVREGAVEKIKLSAKI